MEQQSPRKGTGAASIGCFCAVLGGASAALSLQGNPGRNSKGKLLNTTGLTGPTQLGSRHKNIPRDPAPAERRQHFPVHGSEIPPGNTSRSVHQRETAQDLPGMEPCRLSWVCSDIGSAELVLQVPGSEAGPPSLS
ncbi:hypothetical protein Nmel_017689 [Mimus melanotis]